VDTPENIVPAASPARGVSPVWRGLAFLTLAAAAVLALLATKYAAALRYDSITDSAERAALDDRITSLEHDVVAAHSQIASLRQQLETSGKSVQAALMPDSRIIHLAPLGAVPNASAAIAETPLKSEAVLLVSGLPAPPAGESYELWWIGVHGEAIKAATFHPDQNGAAIADATLPPASAHVVADEITLQRSQSADKPDGTIYFRGATQ